MWRSASWLAVLGASVPGCLLTIDESLLDGATDSGTPPEACPSGMVTIGEGPSCVDATEVTNQAYEAFVIARNGDLSLRPASCASDAQNEPSADWPPQNGKSSHPVVFVDWCDAFAFCAHQDKALCSGDLWRAACGPAAYPYGATYDQNACHGDETNQGRQRTMTVGSHPDCEGGRAGVFDLSGNVEEWVDECTGDDCGLAGGSYLDPPAALACEARRTAPRATSAATRGFRCCRP